jgi:toxin ParE2
VNYQFTSVALKELTQAALHYDNKEQGLGLRFFTEVDQTVNRILASPEAWRPLSPRTRRCLVRAFPFGVLYQIRRTEILIVSVMDLRRDPARWQKHL